MLLIRCFFFNDTATTEIYTLSLHDALPIWRRARRRERRGARPGDMTHVAACRPALLVGDPGDPPGRRRRFQEVRRLQEAQRSEEHTSELQSRQYLVCRLLLEKKKKPHHLEC